MSEDIVTFNVPPNQKPANKRVKILDKIFAIGEQSANSRKPMFAPTWMKVEPRSLEITYKPFQRKSGNLLVQLTGVAGKGVNIQEIQSSSPDFTIKNADKILPSPVAYRIESLALEWELVCPYNQESTIVLYFIGSFGGVTSVQPYKVLLTPEEPDLTVLLDNVDFRVEEGQTHNQVIWVYNPLKSPVQVESIKCPEKEQPKLNRGWKIKEKLARDPMSGDINYDNMTPADFWLIEPGEKKPIGEISFTPTAKDDNTRMWLSSHVDIKLRVKLNGDNHIGKELIIPIRYYKKHPNRLLDEEYIDMGIITSREVAHKYVLRVENKYGKNAVITKIAVRKQGQGINLQVATAFSYKVVLPTAGVPFDLLTLFVLPVRTATIGHLYGVIELTVDVQGIVETISIPFSVSYFLNLFADEEQVSFQLKRNVRDGRIINKVEGYFKHKFPTDLIIEDIKFVDLENTRTTASFTPFLEHNRLTAGESVKAFSAQFIHVDSFFDNSFSRGYEIATVKTLQSFSTVLIKYYSLGLMCGFHNTISSSYEKCKNVEKLEFGYIALDHRKVMTMDIFNPTMVSYIIKRIEFTDGSGNVEVSFENQSRYGMKSFFKKVSKTMNTFVLFPQGEIVSLRIRVKPKAQGSFKETISIFTNRGEFSLVIVYKGIQGEILFSPSSLRFDLFYPIESDEKSVIAKNKFNIDVEINNVYSPQNFIFCRVKNPYLRENSKDNFLGVILDLTDEEIVDIDRPGFLKMSEEAKPTIADLVEYDDQQKGWEKIIKEAKTEITGEVVVQTDLMSDLKLQVKGHLRKAMFIQEEELVVGPLEEKRAHKINVTLTNPTGRDVSVRFFIADSRLIDFKRLVKKVIRGLKKRFSKYKQEHICLTHPSYEPESIQYYAQVLFEEVEFRQVGKDKSNKRRVCFTTKKWKSSMNKFFEKQGNYLFNISRISRKTLIRDTMESYVLRDVLIMSNKQAPAVSQSIYKMALLDKLTLIFQRMKKSMAWSVGKKPKMIKKSNSIPLQSVSPQIMRHIESKQEFFINPEYRNRKIVIPTGQSLSLPVLIFNPRNSLSRTDSKINLLVKNDYSNIAILPVTASVGVIELIVQKVIHINEGGSTSILQKKEEFNRLIFNVHSSELVQRFGRDGKKFAFKKNVKRLYELKNNGNLPLQVKEVRVGDNCSFSGFAFSNCEGFEIPPGGTYKLEVVLVNPHNFQPELKKDVHLVMEGRVLVLSFEVKAADPLLIELANFGFSSMASQMFKIVSAIFMVVLGLVFYRYYQETGSEVNWAVTEVHKNRFGESLFCDNIFDLRLLESNVRIRAMEAQKNRQIRSVGLKELMTKFDKEASFTSEKVEPEPAIEPVHTTNYKKVKSKDNKYPYLFEEDNVVLPSKTSKKKKAKKAAHQAPQTIKSQSKETTLPITDNILDNINDDLPPKTPPPQQIKRSRPQSPKIVPSNDQSEHKNDKNQNTKPTEFTSPNDAKGSVSQGSSHIRSRKISHHRRKDSYKDNHHRDKQSVNNSSDSVEWKRKDVTAVKKNKDLVSDGASEVEEKDPEYHRNPNQQSELVVEAPKSREEGKSFREDSRESYNSKQIDTSTKQKDKERKVRDRKRDVVYYQRIDKAEKQDAQDKSMGKIVQPDGLPKLTIEEQELELNRNQSRGTVNNSSPLKSMSGITPITKPNRFNPRDNRRIEASFSEEEGTQYGKSFDRNHNMISFNNPEISMIHSVEDAASNSSQLLLKDSERIRQVQRDPDSSESVEDDERSHEKIRQLLQGTEEANDDSSIYDNEIEEPKARVIGVIGGNKGQKKSNSNIGGGSSLLGFRHSENKYKYFSGAQDPQEMQQRYPEDYRQGRTISKPVDSYMAEPNRRPGHTGPGFSEFNQGWGYDSTSSRKDSPAMQFGIYSNPYGSYVRRDQIQRPQEQYRPAGLSRLAEHSYNDQGHNSPYNYSNEEYPLHSRYGQGRMQMYNDQDEAEQDDYPYGLSHLNESFENKQFKAQMNNPFTLRKLGGSKPELGQGNYDRSYSPNEQSKSPYPWGNLARPTGLYQKDEYSRDIDNSYSENNMSSSRTHQLKPPPGLTNDDNEMEEEEEEPKHRRVQPNMSGSGLEQSKDSSRGGDKKQDKMKFNLFGY